MKPPSGYSGPISIRLQSAGISLLAPHLTVLDAAGNVLGDAQTASDQSDAVTVRLDQSNPSATYYLEVRGASQDVFGVGSYALGMTFDSTLKTSPDALEAVMRGPYQSLGPNDIDALFLDPVHALFNQSQNSPDIHSATRLTATPGYAHNSHYEAIGSISTPSDVDFYEIPTADVPSGGQGLVLTATVRALDPNGATPRVAIIGNDNNQVSAQVIANSNGTYTIQATNVKGGGSYFLRVTADGSASNPVGNYALDAQFGGTAAALTNFASGNLGADTSQTSANLYVGESQLFQFLLSANAVGAPAGTALQMTIVDSTGKLVYSLTANVGDVVSGNALFLTPGAYTLSFSTIGPVGSNTPVSYALQGEDISDPIGPALEDPTLTPVFTSPTLPDFFVYPGNIVTDSPFWISTWPTPGSPPIPA